MAIYGKLSTSLLRSLIASSRLLFHTSLVTSLIEIGIETVEARDPVFIKRFFTRSTGRVERSYWLDLLMRIVLFLFLDSGKRRVSWRRVGSESRCFV
jgi:hypothetical protein